MVSTEIYFLEEKSSYEKLYIMALSPLGTGKPTMLHAGEKAMLPHSTLLAVYYFVVQKGGWEGEGNWETSRKMKEQTKWNNKMKFWYWGDQLGTGVVLSSTSASVNKS